MPPKGIQEPIDSSNSRIVRNVKTGDKTHATRSASLAIYAKTEGQFRILCRTCFRSGLHTIRPALPKLVPKSRDTPSQFSRPAFENTKRSSKHVLQLVSADFFLFLQTAINISPRTTNSCHTKEKDFEATGARLSMVSKEEAKRYSPTYRCRASWYIATNFGNHCGRHAEKEQCSPDFHGEPVSGLGRVCAACVRASSEGARVMSL